MKKASPLLLTAFLLLFAFGCNKTDDPTGEEAGSPLMFNSFPTCEGTQVTGSGSLQYTIYASQDDWMTGANPISSGSAEYPSEIVIPDLEDGTTYFYDIQVGDRDNWFGGNVAAPTMNNYSFTYRAAGFNQILPKLYRGQSEVWGTYLLSDVLAGGTSILSSLDDCIQDNFLTIDKAFQMVINEGADVCPSTSASAGYSFYYQSCELGNAEVLEDYQSAWYSTPGHEKITFSKVNGSSQITLEILTTSGLREYVYVR